MTEFIIKNSFPIMLWGLILIWFMGWLYWQIKDKRTYAKAAVESAEVIKSIDGKNSELKLLLTEFDQYSQTDSDYMGSPFRQRVLDALDASVK